MKLLITRPIERIEPLKSRLECIGHDVISSPLFQVIPLVFEPFDIKDYDGVIVTSSFALSFVPQGAKVISLADRVKEIGKGRYIYLQGEYVTQELNCDTRIVYTTKAAEVLTPIDIDGVLLFSKRTAQIFEKLWQGSRDIEVFCLSAAIADHLRYHYRKIHVAKSATLEGILDILTLY